VQRKSTRGLGAPSRFTFQRWIVAGSCWFFLFRSALLVTAAHINLDSYTGVLQLKNIFT
jgi:hypothetical protein